VEGVRILQPSFLFLINRGVQVKKCKYIRKDHVITTVGAKTKQNFESINLAKKASRNIQLSEDGALGLGVVQAS
jgi:hypothetical protein